MILFCYTVNTYGMRYFFSVFFLFFIIGIFSVYCIKVFAYTTGMNASVVIGQVNFTSSSANTTANTFNAPSAVIVAGSKLIISDNNNNRILIFNTIPTQNSTSADVVIGQANFTSSGSGCSANKLNLGGGGGLLYINGKLFVADTNNHRVLIFNSVPTANNVSADFVIGQSNFTTCTSNTGGINAKTLFSPTAIATDGKKLLIADMNNNRVLVYNNFPIANNPSADIVIGQQDFVSNVVNASNIDETTMASPSGVTVNSDGMVFIADNVDLRVLTYNGIPSKNGISADNVLGQSTFTSSVNTKTASKVAVQSIAPFQLSSDANGSIYIAENTNNRVSIFSAYAATQNPAGDIFLGQLNNTNIATNSGGLSQSSLSNPKHAFPSGKQLFVADTGNNRVLIYNNNNITPTVNIINSPAGQPDATVTITGNASVDLTYSIKDVQFSANGGGWYDTTSSNSNGLFNTSSAGFSFNFDPTANNNLLDGYTARVRAISTNGDISNMAFFFAPFFINKPDDNSFVSTLYPTFDFFVNAQRTNMRDGLLRYQIWVSPTNNTNWQLYIDNIPIEFQKVATTSDNLQKNGYSATDLNGTYETANLTAVYDQNSSHISVFAKEAQQTSFESGGKALNGAYKWKVVAVDPAGHTLETPFQHIRVNTGKLRESQSFFPLSILFISGIGNTNLSSITPSAIANEYTTASTVPVFYGITSANATVSLSLTDSDCTDSDIANCTNVFTTTANLASRFGINVSDGTLTSGKKYIALLSAQLNNDYIELPTFTLSIANAEQPKTKSVKKILNANTPLLNFNYLSCNNSEEKNFTYLLKPVDHLFEQSCFSSKFYPFTILPLSHA